jgi:hypothetical protein
VTSPIAYLDPQRVKDRDHSHRAGIIWEVGESKIEVSIPPEETRWCVFHVGFGRRVHDEGDLVEQLREWLPELRRRHLTWRAERSS